MQNTYATTQNHYDKSISGHKKLKKQVDVFSYLKTMCYYNIQVRYLKLPLVQYSEN